MEVILLEKIKKLGDLGETVKVAPGYGRNFLLPQGKALPATEANKAVFEARKAELVKRLPTASTLPSSALPALMARACRSRCWPLRKGSSMAPSALARFSTPPRPPASTCTATRSIW